MSWNFSRALVVEYSDTNCSDTEPSAQSNMTDMPQVYSCSDKMMAFYRRSRSGMTCELLTESRGEELLIAYLAGFHAKTLVQQGKGQELTEIDQDYGPRCLELLAKYDRNSSSWKTQTGLFPEDLAEFSETWPLSGTMRNGCAYELPNAEHGITDRARGYLPTPQASDNRNRGGPKNPVIQARIKKGKQITLSQTIDGPMNPEWVELLMGWPIRWTDLNPLGMDKFQSWRRLHFKN